ncbi:double zinc ribbon and ankyrin repeat-containing protein 1 [Octopus sinensis]|uniref:Double zinc ribbon and ankyrin repeat-containing protein 1 n=1 Tax=Octopus sinensis TaxID=2607531 RepID=A0A6P7SIB9_9MOLL|nr:double zinc ribbon and ankyrin repeat-containing protein 1 [Octopus sinensis]
MTAGSVPVPMVIPMRVPQLGKPKASIDTNTKIALCSSGNSEVDIFYTLNGTKPEAFPLKRTPEFCTLTYKGPFPLPAGKVTLKAVAVSKDGVKESNIVTKTFDVEYVPATESLPANNDGLDFQEEVAEEKAKLEKKRSMKNFQMVLKPAWATSPSPNDATFLMSKLHIPDEKRPSSARFLDERFKNKNENRKDTPTSLIRTYQIQTIADQLSASEWKGIPEPHKAPNNPKEIYRLQRQTDFLKCVYCFADRPADPCAKFCNVCGREVPPLPQNRLLPPEPGQMGNCIYCNSLVPFNTETCVVCEGPIPVQNQPKASIKLTDRLVCKLCGTANPCNLSACVICDSKLSPATDLKKFPDSVKQQDIPLESKFVKCSKCLRINNADARFCDWCGNKPNLSTYIQCPRCKATNHVMSTYCASCAALIEPPHRNTSNEFSEPINSANTGQWTVAQSTNYSSRSKQSTGTQTIGLFYPSQREITKKEMQDEEKKSYEKQLRDRQPLLTAISPGRGFWRKQVEHICHHLKVHAQNCAEFRGLIAEPRMGRLVSGTIHEDSFELSLTLNFSLCQSKSNLTNGHTPSRSADNLQSPYRETNILDTFRSESSLVSAETSDASMVSSSNKKKKKKTRRLNSKKHKLSAIDKNLFQQFCVNGEGDIKEVQRLFDEGADPNCTNKNDFSVLHVAVKNKHKDCIPVIVQAGADIHRKGPVSCQGNTVLHEAVKFGDEGLEIVDTLLRCGAEASRTNDRGETAHDLAKKCGYDKITTRLMSSLGQAQLEKLLSNKPLQID